MKSPYYFVPLNKEVFYPDWSDKVSHDIPFSDGECGKIEIEIKAEKPIFIRNHYEHNDKHEEGKDYYLNKQGDKVSTEFCHTVNAKGNKKYFIPSTSFRNMIKKYMRVLSFGEIQIDKTKHSEKLTGRDNNNSKFTYEYTILDAVEQTVDSEKEDLINMIFGYSSKRSKLKGRVTTSHFFAEDNVKSEKEIKMEILGEPKETFFPSYIKQINFTSDGKVDKYITLNDEESQIAGYKFYPLQKGIQSNPPTGSNKKVATQFRPLEKDSVFQGSIRYHNLRKEELGALLSALTFHGNAKTHHHNMGMAKPLGYGEISITIKAIDSMHNNEGESVLCIDNIPEYLDAFETMMNSINTEVWSDVKLFEKWSESEQYRELFSIFNIDNRGKLEYPKLRKIISNNRKINEFEEIKKFGEYLTSYSVYVQQQRETKNTQPNDKSIAYKSENKPQRVTPSPIDRNAPIAEGSVVSNKKLNERLNKIWLYCFGIQFRKNQFMKYADGNIETLQNEVRNGYKKIEKSKKWKKLCNEISAFYDRESQDVERLVLYKKLKKITCE